jgi:hypothetical protein
MFSGRDRAGIIDILGRLAEINEEMPPFAGTPVEKEALADYLDSFAGGTK